MLDELLMIPGPTTLSSRVREALAQPQWSHSSPEFHDAFVDLLELTKYAFVTRDGFPYVITGSGTVSRFRLAPSHGICSGTDRAEPIGAVPDRGRPAPHQS